jgi:capsule polysaccharide export protein KpsE/RkpR
MSGESPSLTRGLPDKEDIVLVPRDEAALAEEFEDRQVRARTAANLRFFWTHRKFMMRAGLYALIASVLIAFLIPARYESTARLMPPDNQSGSGLMMTALATMTGGATGGAGGGIGSIASDLLGLKSTSDIFLGILSSHTVQDKLIQQFDLKKLYRDKRIEDARDDLEDRTSTSVDRKSQIITITVTDKSPRRATAMARAYVDELNRLVAELSTSSARRERIFLEGRLQGVNKDLEAAEKDFGQFSSKNTTIDIREQGRAMVEAAAALQGELIAAESELEGLKQIYADNNVRVRSIRARIDELRHQLDKIGGKGEDLSAPVDGQQDSIYPSIRKLPLLGVPYADLYRNTRVQEAVFETLTKEYELAKVQEAKEIPTVKVLDVPSIPEKRSFPPRLIIIFLGTMFGLIAAMTWIVGKTRWDVADLGDPRKELAIEVFTTLRSSMPRFSGNGANGNSNGNSPRVQQREPDGPSESALEDGSGDAR